VIAGVGGIYHAAAAADSEPHHIEKGKAAVGIVIIRSCQSQCLDATCGPKQSDLVFTIRAKGIEGKARRDRRES
jgi:uncharacterized metal-binding protein